MGTVPESSKPLVHIPVLPEEIAGFLPVEAGDTVVDATVGSGGHARMLAQRLGPKGRLIGLDVDPGNLSIARAALAGCTCRIDLVHENYRRIRAVLAAQNVEHVDVVLADLGVSSTQLDDPERGLSFQQDGPLDMRLDPRLEVTASDLVNRLSERELADLIYFNAQEMKSRRIARHICRQRRDRRITTTGRLAEITCRALGVRDPSSRRSRIHPATRTFQALRMAVNDEPGALAAFLQAAPNVLKPGGRIAIIAFHSVEDKPVKLNFRKRKSEGTYELLTKKPVIASPEERERNPRSRSAKLRVARRLETRPALETG
ncbi:MAG: 16S rRNA (cytosine(1402)-N(4))-methyltransferase RsmH [Phycisphaerae bacterium]